MKMEKIWNSGVGIVLAILAILIAGRTMRLISWTLLRACGYAFLGAILVLALSNVRKKN